MMAQAAALVLDGWKEIAAHLEEIAGSRKSRFTLMRWANQPADPLPVKRDPSNRPYAHADELRQWWERHQFVYGDRSTRSNAQSVVYFAQDGEFIKIGFSSLGAESRLESLQCGNPRLIVILGTVPGSKALETSLHARFSHLRERGEWFRTDPDLLTFIGNVIAPMG